MVLREAAEIGTQYAGAASPVTLQARLFLGEAQLAAGERVDAQATLTAARDAALKQYGESHILSLRARLAMARLTAATGLASSVRDELLPVLALLRKAGKQADSYTAQALELFGDIELATGHPPAAVARLTEAVSIRERTGVQDWELAQARERLGEALMANGRAAEASSALTQASQTLEKQLGPNHPETLRAKQALARR